MVQHLRLRRRVARLLAGRCGPAYLLACALALAATLPGPAAAQFGQNKVQYRHFKWQVLETEHFKIHYYEQERPTALEASRMAERSYEYLSEFFQHEITDKIPVILYSSHQDFEQSNVIGGFISEGTGGVTESLKGRVTLPLTGSFAELNHVLTHELVHAFQFDMMERNVRGMLGIGPLPLWMVEGMAEWVSNGMDPVTAMWVTDAVRRSKLPTLEKMAGLQDIRVYRMGQALYQVIGQSYGPERVRRIVKRPEPAHRAWRDSTFLGPDETSRSGRDTPPTADSLAFAPGSTASQSLEKLWRSYADSVAHTLGTGLVDPDSTAERVTRGKKYGRSFSISPSLSPDGSRILYYSSRGFRNELFLAERDGDGWKLRSLVAGEENAELESLPLLSASVDWSPDGREVVFVATQQGRDVLQIYDVDRQRIMHTLRTDLLSLSNPSFSPDGRWIVFSALEGGQEDLFLIEVHTGKLVRLTQDAFAERTPRFSPDGDAIAFASERGPKSDAPGLVFGPWNIVNLHLRHDGDTLAADQSEVLVESDANDFAPVWSPDGTQLAFISDRDGTYQVYTLDRASGEVRKRTRFDAGVVGIVPTGPALSWSKSGELAFSVFRNGGWNIYRMPTFPEDLPGDPDAARLAFTRSQPRELREPADNDLVKQDRGYKVRLTPEYAVLGALYVGNAGAAGSGQLLLGDMLGNHYLLVAGNLRGNLDESEFLLQYANLGHRWQWGLAGYQFRDDIGVFTAPDTARVRSLVRRGAAAQLAYPFNRFRRIEFGVDMQTVSDEVAEVLFVNGKALVNGSTRSHFFYAIPSVALVSDNTAHSGFTPVAGGRWRGSVERSIGDLEFTFGLLDWRRYLNIHTRGAVALRLLGAGSTGRDTQLLRIGGPDTFRGADYGELTGTRVAVGNLELRFPIIPATELIRGILFVDLASTWSEDQKLRFAEPGGPFGFRLHDALLAYGLGLRAYIGLPLRFDAALPTDLDHTYDWRTSFSIGFDF